MAFNKLSLSEKIEIKSERRDECILWTGSKDAHGYGQIRIDGKWKKAHRVNYELHKGAIPSGLVIMHKCDNTSCINIEHLTAGTQADNLIDMHKKKRAVYHNAENHCRSKLTNTQVLEIRRRFKSYSRIDGSKPLAREFGVSHAAILAIISRKSWASI